MNMSIFLSASRYFIAIIAPWMITVCLILTGIILMRMIPNVYRQFLKLHRSVRILLFLCIFVGGYIRFAWVPSGHRIYFDEDRYLSYAVNFARHGEAVSLMAATPEKILLGDPDPAARVTVPTLNAWILKIFGYDEAHLFNLARFVSLATIVLIFSTVFMLFEDQYAAAIAATIFSFVPINVYWSVSTNIDAYFVSFSLLSLLSMIWYARRVSPTSILFAWCTTSLLLFVRFESFLFLPTLIAAVSTIRHTQKNPVFIRRDSILIGLLIPLVLIRAAVSLPVFSKTWCCAEATPLEIFSPNYIARNTIPNLFTFVNRPEFPMVISILACICLFSFRALKKQTDRHLTLFIPWILAFFFIYSFYYAGQYFSYTFSGSYGRFFLMEVAPLTILASLQIRRIFTYFLTTTYERRNWIMLGLILAIFTVIPTIFSYRRLISISPWDGLVEVGPRRLHGYIDDVIIQKTPPQSAIIFGILAPIHLAGKTVIYNDAFLTDEKVMTFVHSLLDSGKPVFIFSTHTCEIYPEKCTRILKEFELIPYVATNDDRYKGFEMQQIVLKRT